MFDVSLMTLQSIRICQQVLRVKVISPCMHYLSCTISEHTKPHSQELPKMDQWKKAVVSTKKCFSASYFFKHMFSMYVMRLQNIRLRQEILWEELISLFYVLLSCQSKFSRRPKGINHKWMNSYALILFNNNISSISTLMQNMKRFLELFIQIRSRSQNGFSRITKRNNPEEVNQRALIFL